MKLVRWIVGTVFAFAAVLFAVGNLQPVSIVWSPVHAALEMPVSVFGLGMMAGGFILGCVLVWINGESIRRDRRAQRRRIRDLENALEAANENAAQVSSSPPATQIPALPALPASSPVSSSSSIPPSLPPQS